MLKIVKYLILMLVSIGAGIYLMVWPQEVNPWVIRYIGLWWCFEGVLYSLKIVDGYLNNKGY